MDFKADLIRNLRELVPLEPSEESLVVNEFRAKTLKKGEYLLLKDEVSSHMRFIASGALRSYYIDAQGKENTLQLGIEGWWINDLYSYLTQTPAKHHVQAVEDSVVLQVHRDALKKLNEIVPLMERFFCLKIQRGYIALQERTVLRMSQTAEERYLDFRSKYRSLEQRFPQYMIASYLDITPEFLSAVRKKISTH